MADLTHECPAPGCMVRVDQDRLACPRHWYRLPAALRARIWRLWSRGPEEEHAAAVREAIDWLEVNA